MKKSLPASDLQRTTGFLGDLVRQARLVWRLLHDRRISGWVKLVPLAGLVYLLSPVDLIPDIAIPGLGQMDDLAVILLSLKLFVDFCPPAIVRQHLEELVGRQREADMTDELPSEDYIDIPYRVVEREEQ